MCLGKPITEKLTKHIQTAIPYSTNSEHITTSLRPHTGIQLDKHANTSCISQEKQTKRENCMNRYRYHANVYFNDRAKISKTPQNMVPVWSYRKYGNLDKPVIVPDTVKFMVMRGAQSATGVVFTMSQYEPRARFSSISSAVMLTPPTQGPADSSSIGSHIYAVSRSLTRFCCVTSPTLTASRDVLPAQKERRQDHECSQSAVSHAGNGSPASLPKGNTTG
jgi:hypothetical protein